VRLRLGRYVVAEPRVLLEDGVALLTVVASSIKNKIKGLFLMLLINNIKQHVVITTGRTLICR
jgi:hypothetical protein